MRRYYSGRPASDLAAPPAGRAPGGRPSLGRRIATAVRLPVDLHARLDAAATERDVSINYLVTRAVERYLDTMPPLPKGSDDE